MMLCLHAEETNGHVTNFSTLIFRRKFNHNHPQKQAHPRYYPLGSENVQFFLAGPPAEYATTSKLCAQQLGLSLPAVLYTVPVRDAIRDYFNEEASIFEKDDCIYIGLTREDGTTFQWFDGTALDQAVVFPWLPSSQSLESCVCISRRSDFTYEQQSVNCQRKHFTLCMSLKESARTTTSSRRRTKVPTFATTRLNQRGQTVPISPLDVILLVPLAYVVSSALLLALALAMAIFIVCMKLKLRKKKRKPSGSYSVKSSRSRSRKKSNRSYYSDYDYDYSRNEDNYAFDDYDYDNYY